MPAAPTAVARPTCSLPIAPRPAAPRPTTPTRSRSPASIRSADQIGPALAERCHQIVDPRRQQAFALEGGGATGLAGGGGLLERPRGRELVPAHAARIARQPHRGLAPGRAAPPLVVDQPS